MLRGLRGDERQLCSLSSYTWLHLQQKCLFSQRTNPLLRLWVLPLVSKSVIIVSFSEACLTGWPSDLFHLLTVPWWLAERPNTFQLHSLQATATSVDDCGSMSSTISVCHTGRITSWLHLARRHLTCDGHSLDCHQHDQEYYWQAVSAGTVRAVKHTKSHLLKSVLTHLNSAVINSDYSCQLPLLDFSF